ncbi:MAG: DUF1385 domain-containing protein [Oscillospiraceae bacterium]|nr:DUF1385 domain-containing protein [Oscillospiraceae bacterium]
MAEEKQSCPSFKTMIGGQALIEGIMMRGPSKQSIVVRKPDGELEVKTEELQLVKEKHPILGVPFIRGSVNFIDSMVKGVKALMYSAEFYPEDEEEADEEPSKLDAWLTDKLGSEKTASVFIGLAVAVGLVFSIVLFMLVPTALGGAFMTVFPSTPFWVRHLFEGVVRIAIFIGYLAFCSRTKDIKRVFSYHGAEHKTIFCYERGLELTVENVRDMPRHHPRCGTSFLFVVIIVAILLYSVLFSIITPPNIVVRMLLQVAMLPIIVGITYELNRLVGRHDNALTRFLTKPGLWLQNFTTFEPDDTMIEVGIEALKQVLPDQKGADIW